MTVLIGVDPGKSGAVAILTPSGALIEVIDMPVAGKIISPALLDEAIHNHVDPLDPFDPGVAVIEDVHAMPKQGVTSVFSFGRSLGVVEGVLAGNGFGLRYVSPAAWKRDLRLSKDKGASRRRAAELWPAKASLFKRVKDDGRAEAALIAHWWLVCGQRVEAA